MLTEKMFDDEVARILSLPMLSPKRPLNLQKDLRSPRYQYQAPSPNPENLSPSGLLMHMINNRSQELHQAMLLQVEKWRMDALSLMLSGESHEIVGLRSLLPKSQMSGLKDS